MRKIIAMLLAYKWAKRVLLMDILIIIPRFVNRPIDFYNLPLGLLYVASVVRKYGERNLLIGGYNIENIVLQLVL